MYEYSNKEWLEENMKEYNTLIEFANSCSVAPSTITRWLKKHNIISPFKLGKVLTRDEFGRKRCKECGLWKNESEFNKHKSSTDKLKSECRECNHKYGHLYNKKNSVTIGVKNKNRRKKVKLQVFTHYSRGVIKCSICGYNNIDALSIDHINGGGHKHTKEVGMGSTFYLWLIKNNFPEGYRVLCRNCNWLERIRNMK